MSTFKKTKVVMLSTNEKATVGSIVTRPSDNRMATVNVLTKDDTQPCIHQHLYFLSDEEIKEGDWFVGFADGSISPFVKQADKSTVEINNWQLNKKGTSSNKKIIATTDKSLTINSIYGIDSFDASIFSGSGKSEMIKLPQMFNLPQPSQSFIEKFVEEYNKGNQITEVMVEYEEGKYNLDELRERHLKGLPHSYDYCNLKVNPKDNTITIRKKKDSLNRAELDPILELIREIATDNLDRVSGGIKNKAIERLKWIEENL